MTQDQPASKSETRQFSTRDFLSMIFRRKWVILSIFFVTLAMGVSASLKTTSEYQAVAKVLIRRAEGSSFAKLKSPYLGLEEEMNTEIEILRSKAVLERALATIENEIEPLAAEEKAERFPPRDDSQINSHTARLVPMATDRCSRASSNASIP